MRLKLLAMTFGIFLAAGTAYAGPVPGGLDSDGDTVENAFDNCSGFPNANQSDTDHDACGNSCDFDLNNNGIVSIGEVTLLAGQFGPCAAPPASCQCDLNGNGTCSIGEVTVIANTFGQKPGLSGITTAQCNTTLCNCTPAP